MAKGNLEQVGHSTTPMKDILTLGRKPSSGKVSSANVWKEQNSEKKQSLNVIPTGGKTEKLQMHHRVAKGLYSGMRSRKRLIQSSQRGFFFFFDKRAPQ